jgi:hypothetical protein
MFVWRSRNPIIDTPLLIKKLVCMYVHIQTTSVRSRVLSIFSRKIRWTIAFYWLIQILRATTKKKKWFSDEKNTETFWTKWEKISKWPFLKSFVLKIKRYKARHIPSFPSQHVLNLKIHQFKLKRLFPLHRFCKSEIHSYQFERAIV